MNFLSSELLSLLAIVGVIVAVGIFAVLAVGSLFCWLIFDKDRD